jgi:cobalt/nickel transport system permease protein
MHMSDALLSPAVGGTLWVAAAGLAVVSARRVERDPDPRRVPLMGVLGAFVFAAQMVSFSIPGTGSSGHLGGGLLLAALLGPSAAFVVLASVLTVQALFFADGGLLALGANVLNVGAASCFAAYPLVFRPLAGQPRPGARLVAASVAAGTSGLALGAVGVVLETSASGISTLPLAAFLSLMLPVHLAIGAVEGIATAAVLSVLWRARPELLSRAAPVSRLRPVVASLAAAALVVGGACSYFASSAPDGLEWSVSRTAGAPLRPPVDGVRAALARIQQTVAPFPEYGLRSAGSRAAPDAGTSLAGIAGAALTLAFVLAAFCATRALLRRPDRSRGEP